MGLARMWKQSKPARGTHSLEGADIEADQDMETKQGGKGGSLAGEGRHWDWSGYGNKAR